MKKSILITLAALLCAFSYAQMPNGFSFQGYARNANGVPLKNITELSVKFQLFVEDSPKFEEEQTLSTNEFGVFQAVIGKIEKAKFESLDFASYGYTLKVYVEENLGTENWIMVANKPLMTVPYAMASQNASFASTAGTAEKADDADNASYATTAANVESGGNGVPVGTIVPFAGSTVPAGWLLCNGVAYSGYSEIYTELYNAIGLAWGGSSKSSFRVPDLRGQFLRGVSSSTSQDPDRSSRTRKYTGGNTGANVGSYQSDTYGSHSHTVSSKYRTSGATSDKFGYGAGGNEDFGGTGKTSSDGGSETRPKNAYVNYIIKY